MIPGHSFDRQEFADRMLKGLKRVGRQTEGVLVLPHAYEDPDADSPTAVCALGAAAIGYGTPWRSLRGRGGWWPAATEDPFTHCPHLDDPDWEMVDCENQVVLSDVITHLNDDHAWPISEIAAWIVDPTYRPEAQE